LFWPRRILAYSAAFIHATVEPASLIEQLSFIGISSVVTYTGPAPWMKCTGTVGRSKWGAVPEYFPLLRIELH
jgi:hypothetical protein